MKKLFAILAIAGTLAACNNGGDEKTPATDTSKMTNPATDATKMADSAVKKMTDTATKMMNKVADSAVNKMKDAANKMTDKKKAN